MVGPAASGAKEPDQQSDMDLNFLRVRRPHGYLLARKHEGNDQQDQAARKTNADREVEDESDTRNSSSLLDRSRVTRLPGTEFDAVVPHERWTGVL
jgi:hypothetical protein